MIFLLFIYLLAIRCDPSNPDYIWARCNLYEQVGEHTKALEGYQSILQLMTVSGADAEDYWRLARDTSRVREGVSFLFLLNTSSRIHNFYSSFSWLKAVEICLVISYWIMAVVLRDQSNNIWE